MLAKKIVMLGLVATSLSLPVMSFALADLYVNNNTNSPVTSEMNGGSCSTILPGGEGVTGPGVQNHKILGHDVEWACALKSNCIATIFLTDHCGTPDQAVATVPFDASMNGKGMNGSPSYPTPNPVVTISGTGFYLTISNAG